MPAVREIDDQPDDKPDNQAIPVQRAKLIHHIAIEDNSEYGNDWNPGRAEGPRLAWICSTEHHNRDADDDECQQRADIHHLSDVVNREGAADESGEQADKNRIFVGSAKARMNRSKELLGQQTVIRHRVENTRLSQ